MFCQEDLLLQIQINMFGNLVLKQSNFRMNPDIFCAHFPLPWSLDKKVGNIELFLSQSGHLKSIVADFGHTINLTNHTT